ncbi:hypothetical protein [Microbacterium sp. GXF7504]
MSRTMWWVAGGLAALLVAVVVLVSVLLVTLQRQAYQERWEACVERLGIADAPTDDVDKAAEYLVDIARRCEAMLN